VQGLRVIRGVFVGTRGPSMRLVPVPIRKYPKNTPRSIDALFRCYVPYSTSREGIVVNLDDFITQVKQYPPDSDVDQPYSYTIFSSNYPFAEPNHLLRSFVGGEQLRTRGNVLVMKSDQDGTLRPMNSADFFFVQRLLVDLDFSYLMHLRVTGNASRTVLTMQFFSMPELVLEVLSYCDFSTVMAVSRTNSHGRSIARLAVLYRIRRELKPFIPSSRFIDFIDMLHLAGGGIVGSVARLMFADNSLYLMGEVGEDGLPAKSKPADLNLVVLPRKMDLAIKHFKSHGYSKWSKIAVAEPYRGMVTEVKEGIRPASGNQPKATVNISQCNGSLMEVVLAAPLTALANLITPLSVYAVYPTLLYKRKTLATDRPGVLFARRTSSCYSIENTNQDWSQPCGYHCPTLDRRSVGDKGIAMFRWNTRYEEPQSRYDDTDYLLADCILAWRFGVRCRNIRCSNYTPAGIV
ncbi:hypothetical protein EST38_g14425, partial [Candolleomyces aberdarensis]